MIYRPPLFFIVLLLSIKYGCSTCEIEADMLKTLRNTFSKPFVEWSPHHPDTTKAEKYQVLFDLYTRHNPIRGETYTLDITGRMFRRLVPSRKTVVLVHGWQTDGHDRLANDFRKAYVRQYDCNFIMVDWSYASGHIYHKSKERVFFVGEVVAEFINKLINEVKVEIPNIHLLGFSLGAHIAGVAGQTLKGVLHRVTGLDPAQPGFFSSSEDRLSVDAAQFVVVIHTSLLGFQSSLGHVDVYVNGGLIQPGCIFKDITGKCSHSRAYAYYAEALMYPKNFQATLCRSFVEYQYGHCKGKKTIYIGEDMDPTTRGEFVMATNSKPPWGKGGR